MTQLPAKSKRCNDRDFGSFLSCCCRHRRRLFCYYHASEYGDLMMSSENYRLYEEESIRFRLAGSQTTRSPSDGGGIRVETKGEERMKKWEKRKTRWSCVCMCEQKAEEEEREIVSHYSFSDFPLLPMMQFFFIPLAFLFRCLSGPPSTPPTHPLLATARRDTLLTNRYSCWDICSIRDSGHPSTYGHLVRPSLLLLLLLPAPGDRNHTHEVFYSSFRENPLALLIRFGFRLSLSLPLSLNRLFSGLIPSSLYTHYKVFVFRPESNQSALGLRSR